MKWIVPTILSCSLCVAASMATAGAWPRGKGKTFASSSASLTWPDKRELELPDVYGSSYLEYGLSKRLTIGLDMGSPDATRPERLKTVGFLRYTLTNENSAHQIAIDSGGGKYLNTDVFRLGMSYGLGFQTLKKNSWISIEAHTLRMTSNTQAAYSLDATYGISLEKGKIMGQFSAYQAFDKARNISLTPSYAHDLGNGRHLEIGVTVGLLGKPDPALKIGIWQEF